MKMLQGTLLLKMGKNQLEEVLLVFEVPFARKFTKLCFL